MFDNMTKDEARAQIIKSVRIYYKAYMKKPPYKLGERINYAGRVFDDDEMANLAESALEFWLTSGHWTDEFEKKLAKYLDVPYCSFVNSGSSANLIAFMALTAPELGKRQIKRGDEVITVACAFPTTVTPMLNYGAVPVFVDVTIPQYNIDVNKLEAALSDKTKAVFIAHTLGNPFDLKSVKAFCKAHDLWLIEDNCDALGSSYTIDGKTRLTGTWGDIGTSSFYPAHHITTGEGGAVYTHSAQLHHIIRSIRDWGRECVCPSGRDNVCGHRFDRQFGTLPKGFDHKYTYSHFGCNLKATDMQAAVGCAQMDKLLQFNTARKHNWQRLRSGLAKLQNKLILPEAADNSKPSWFGFIITCRNGINRNELIEKIEKDMVQTRVLFSGNLTRHPCFDAIRGTNAYRVVGDLDVTDRIMRDTFWIGVYPGMSCAMLDRMINVIVDRTGGGGLTSSILMRAVYTARTRPSSKEAA